MSRAQELLKQIHELLWTQFDVYFLTAQIETECANLAEPEDLDYLVPAR